ncbi:hypothetical protein ACOMHN_027221 [Nucella lapillus]
MEAEAASVKVCVCGATDSQVPLVVQAVANGQVFGATQTVKLTLHDSVERACEVAEEVLDFRDSCYPLLMGVEGETDVDRSLRGSDVIVVVLQTTSLQDLLSGITHYAHALNRIPGTKQKAVVVVSHFASTAAGILRVLAPQLTHHLVTAIEIPHRFLRYSQMGRGGHLLAKIVSEHVATWWSQLQTDDLGMEDIQFSSMLVRYLLPSSRSTTACEEEIHSTIPEERGHSQQDFQDFCAALKHLQISDAQIMSSVLSCRL